MQEDIDGLRRRAESFRESKISRTLLHPDDPKKKRVEKVNVSITHLPFVVGNHIQMRVDDEQFTFKIKNVGKKFMTLEVIERLSQK